MSKQFLNKLYNPNTRMSSMFVTKSEEEFSEALKSSGWSEDAIQKELEELREYKRLFKIEAPKEEVEDSDNELSAALLRVKRKKQ